MGLLGGKKAIFAAAAVLLSATATLCAIEVGLRCVREHALRKNAASLAPIADGDRVILSLGESTAYGMGLPEAESYPALLETSLRDRTSDRSFRVVNLAWPGAISDDIAACFDDALDALPLKVVLVSLGHNDYCYSNNYAVRRELPEGRSAFELADRISPRAETGLVLWRVLSWNVLRSSPAGDRWHRVRDRTGRFRVYYQDDSELAVPVVPKSEIAAVTSNLTANVTRMARASRERGVRLVLVGYLHSVANGVLRDLARELDLPYVDNAVSDARELMTLVRDTDETGRVDRFHPNARGQARMRDNVLRKLEEIGLVARR